MKQAAPSTWMPAGVSGRARRFTLVELLVVLVIMGMMMALAVPTFEKLAIGTGVDAAGRMVGAQMRLAREYAITHRQKVAIIMPGNVSGVDASSRFTTFRSAIVSRSGSDYVFDRWVENTTWSFLPTGASIMEADDDIGIKSGSTYQATPVDDAYSVVKNVPLSPIGSGTADVRAVIFAPTGKVLQTAPAWVTIGEAVFSSGSWIIKKPASDAKNKSCANQVSIVADGYTGRAIYKYPADY